MQSYRLYVVSFYEILCPSDYLLVCSYILGYGLASCSFRKQERFAIGPAVFGYSLNWHYFGYYFYV